MTAINSSATNTERIVVDHQGNAFAMVDKSCPICGPSDFEVVGWRGGRYHRHGLGVETRIVRCCSCRLFFPNPFPMPVDAQQLYGDPVAYFASHDAQGKLENYRKLVQEIGHRIGRPDWSLLDVGCGCGELLHVAAQAGIHGGVGLDFSTAMVAYARETYGVEAHAQTIEEFSAASGRTFDVVTLCGILEHVYDPDAFVASLIHVTKPGSWLFIDIPQEPNLLTMVGNALNRLRGSDSVFNLSPTWLPFHVYGFNVPSLQALFTKHRFVIRQHAAWAEPTICSGPTWQDRMQSFVGTQINRLANVTGTAHNMVIWAQRI